MTEEEVRAMFPFVVGIANNDHKKIYHATQWCLHHIKTQDAIVDADFIKGVWSYLVRGDGPVWAMAQMDVEALYFFQSEAAAVEFKLAFG